MTAEKSFIEMLARYYGGVLGQEMSSNEVGVSRAYSSHHESEHEPAFDPRVFLA